VAAGACSTSTGGSAGADAGGPTSSGASSGATASSTGAATASSTGGGTSSSASGAGSSSGASSGADAGIGDASADGGGVWALSWSDEFDGANGSAPDPNKWTLLNGGDGWGNQELEYYTSDLANAQVQGGNLVITATTAGASAYHCSYPVANNPCEYTSARMQTLGHFAQLYGRFEARIQLPSGQGLWPAFWAMGDNIDTVNWPACGEIDIMENIGKEPGTNHGSLHGPSGSTAYNLTGQYTLPGGANLSDAFHVYALEWQPGQIRFYVDDQLYETQNASSAQPGARGPALRTERRCSRKKCSWTTCASTRASGRTTDARRRAGPEHLRRCSHDLVLRPVLPREGDLRPVPPGV
jgi:beta-glucanase (GH16 family)